MQTPTPAHAADLASESKYGISYPYPYKGGGRAVGISLLASSRSQYLSVIYGLFAFSSRVACEHLT